MNGMRLRELTAAGENLNVELKGESRGSLFDDEIVRTVVCLANR
jgi:ATP-dependent DNA helicase RecG